MIIATASLKGGTGKTSLTVFTALSLARAGASVHVIDLDHNNNATDFFLRDVDTGEIEGRNVFHALTEKIELADAEHKTGFDRVRIIPATPALNRAGRELATDPGAVMRFAAAVRALSADVVLIDTPPALSLELTAALLSADAVLCPVAFSRWTLQGFSLLAEEVNKAGRTTGTPPRLLAVPSIVTEAEAEKLRAVTAWESTQAAIIKAAAIKTAGHTGQDIKPDTKARECFDALAAEIRGK